MDYTLAPSLEHTTLVKIAVTLWKQDDVRGKMAELYSKSFGYKRGEGWKKISKSVAGKIHQFSLPKLLKEEVSGFVITIGLQMLSWINYNKSYFYFDDPKKELSADEKSYRFYFENLNVDNIFWTPHGIIDGKKTIKMFIANQKLDINIRYKLACTYCCEDDIHNLWKQLYKDEFHKNLDKIKALPPLVKFWTYKMAGRISEMEYERNENNSIYEHHDANSPHEYAFQWAVANGNVDAVKYLLQTLASEEIEKFKERNLVKCAEAVARKRHISSYRYENEDDFPKEYYSDVLFFLLSQMNENQQMETLKCCPLEILECLLDWPYQSFFLEASECIWEFLREEDEKMRLKFRQQEEAEIEEGIEEEEEEEIEEKKDEEVRYLEFLDDMKEKTIYLEFINRTDYLLSEMISKTADGYYGYQEILRGFWKQSLTSCKNSVIRDIGGLLSELLRVNDKYSIKLILEDVSYVEKEEFIFSWKGKDICSGLIQRSQQELFEFLVAVCTSSKESVIEFKNEFEQFIISRFKEKLDEKKKVLDDAFQLLDNFINTFPAEQEIKVEPLNLEKQKQR